MPETCSHWNANLFFLSRNEITEAKYMHKTRVMSLRDDLLGYPRNTIY